jgi:hypothetical protein
MTIEGCATNEPRLKRLSTSRYRPSARFRPTSGREPIADSRQLPWFMGFVTKRSKLIVDGLQHSRQGFEGSPISRIDGCFAEAQHGFDFFERHFLQMPQDDDLS